MLPPGYAVTQVDQRVLPRRRCQPLSPCDRNAPRVARAPVGDVDLLSWAFASPSGVLGTTYSFGTSSTRSAAGLTLDIGPLKKAVATRDKCLPRWPQIGG